METSDDENNDSYEKDRSEGNHSIKSASQEDDDDWSRQVETDETMGHLGHDDSLRMMESVTEENNNEDAHRLGGPQPPSQRQLSLKEKLVMRERERRIETERARLKRQFALNNALDSVEQEADSQVDSDMIRLNADMLHQSIMEASRDNGSVADTLGEESIVAHPDEENLDESRLGFNMERFLRNSNSFDPQAKPADSKEQPDQGVLMERFLNEPSMPSLSGAGIDGDANRSVPLNVDGLPCDLTSRQSPVSHLMPSFDDYANDLEKPNSSTMAEARQDNTISRENSMDDHDHMSDIASLTNSHTLEPRLFRLTEADMEELAAIDEASIGNAPPSEREETLSEIGELAGFLGLQPTRFAGGNISVGTPTTAQDESVTTSLLSVVQNNNALSELDRYSDQRSLEGLGTSDIPSQLASSPQARLTDASTSNLPFVSGRDEDIQSHQYNASFVHYDANLKPSSEIHERNEELGESEVVQYRPDNRSIPMDGSHEIDEIRIATRSSLTPIDTDPTAGHWSPSSGMNVSPLQVRRKITSPRDPILNYGSLESGEMFLKPTEYSAQKEAAPLLSKVPPEVVMNGGIPWRQSSEVNLSTVAVLVTGLAVGLLVGIIIGATIIPLITK